jgi:hypothetical protein
MNSSNPLVLASFVPDVAAPIAHFISLKVGDSVHAFRRLGSLTTLRRGAFIAVFGMISIIYVALELFRAMKPGARANEGSARKPLGTVVAVGSAAVRRGVIVSVGTFRGYSDVDPDLSFCSGGVSRDAEGGNSG